MASYATTIVRAIGDLKPPITMVVKKQKTKEIQDWTNADSVDFFMREKDTGTMIIDGGAGTFGGDRTEGELKYQPVADDVDTRGDYDIWFTVYWTSGDNDPQTTSVCELLLRNAWEIQTT